jgi:hypothetical protein
MAVVKYKVITTDAAGKRTKMKGRRILRPGQTLTLHVDSPPPPPPVAA